VTGPFSPVVVLAKSNVVAGRAAARLSGRIRFLPHPRRNSAKPYISRDPVTGCPVLARFGVTETVKGARAWFHCGSAAQSEWLARHALQAHQSGTSRVYVVTGDGDDA
jgi:hypothetical protein